MIIGYKIKKKKCISHGGTERNTEEYKRKGEKMNFEFNSCISSVSPCDTLACYKNLLMFTSFIKGFCCSICSAKCFAK